MFVIHNLYYVELHFIPSFFTVFHVLYHWKTYAVLLFHNTGVCTLRFVHLRENFQFKVLISCVLSVGIFMMFWQDLVVVES
jgi:hypothetical protein